MESFKKLIETMTKNPLNKLNAEVEKDILLKKKDVEVKREQHGYVPFGEFST